MILQPKIKIEGSATVYSSIEIQKEEVDAANHIAEIIATMQLLSVNTQLIDNGQNDTKFVEIAQHFGLNASRVKEMFRSMIVKKLVGTSGIGDVDINYGNK